MLFFACVEIIELPGSTILKLSKQFSLELCVENSSSNLTYALIQVTKWKFFLLRTPNVWGFLTMNNSDTNCLALAQTSQAEG